MRKKLHLKWIAILFLIIFAGCASLAKKEDLASLETKMSALENEIQELKDRQNQLLDLQMKMRKDLKYESEEEAGTKDVSADTPSNKDIQIALKNAGFYKGEIDGKIGSQTRGAVMAFQEQKGLKVDGVVGKNTWELLKEFVTEGQKE